MKEEFKTYVWDNKFCRPPAIDSKKSILKSWLKLKMSRKSLDMSELSSGNGEFYYPFEIQKINDLFTQEEINNLVLSDSFRDNWKSILISIFVIFLLFKGCSGCFNSFNSNKCLDKSDLSYVWKSSEEPIQGYTEDVKLILNDDGTFEVIRYKLNSGVIGGTNSGTWTFDCEENHEYEYGEIVSTKYMNYVYLKGKAPYFRETVIYVFKDTFGNWTLSALEGSGFAIDESKYFERD